MDRFAPLAETSHDLAKQTDRLYSTAAANREKYALMRGGVPVAFRNDKGERVRDRLRAFDFGPVAQTAGLPPNCRRKEFAAEAHRNSVSTPV